MQKPTAIAITYQEPDRCLRATELLREAFPDTPIFVRADEQSRIKKLIQAGATEVIVATGSIATGIGQLLGVRRSSRFGGVLDESGAAIAFGNMATSLYPVMSKEEQDQKLSGLAEEIDSDSDPEETRKLYRLFSTSLSLNDDGRVSLKELVDELLRTSELMATDEQITKLLGCETLNDKCLLEAEENYVTFSEFIALYRKNVVLGKQQ